MDPKTAQILLGAAGSGGAAAATYVDDVFSIDLYSPSGTTTTVTNGIDFAGEGGMVFRKRRDATENWSAHDTERGDNKILYPNLSDAEGTSNNVLTSGGFTSTGLVWDTGGHSGDLVNFSFRKCPGFFDVVTYTGNGTAGRTISHSLGSTPGMVIVKRLNGADNWTVQHRSLGGTKSLYLNRTDGEDTSSTEWNNTAATSTVFTVGTSGKTNANGDTYVAYLFAHDDQSFGSGSDEGIIQCGTYTGNGSSSGPTVDLGFEPQWILGKSTTSGPDWFVLDNMRRWDADGGVELLRANLTNAETELSGSSKLFSINSQGFQVTSTSTDFNANGTTYIYVAVRRPHKPPETATDVFAPKVLTGTIHDPWTPGFAPDAHWTTKHTVSNSNGIATRLTSGFNILVTNSDAAELTGTKYFFFDLETGTVKQTYQQSSTDDGLNYVFKRAPGFFDLVAYAGTGSAKTESHNLGVTPELMLVKRRNATNDWSVYSSVTGATKALFLNGTNAGTTVSTRWNDTAPTSTVFTVGTHSSVNSSSSKYIAYLFATLNGISKVGSYTGTGSNVDVDCGFTAGARFVMVKRTDSTGNWYVWDSERGIVSGDDPHIFFNSNAAQDTNDDYIDPLNAGFTITSSAGSDLNASGGTYLFLAIA